MIIEASKVTGGRTETFQLDQSRTIVAAQVRSCLVVSASEPPELPELEVEYRRPAWVEPPADTVPGIVPLELILPPRSGRSG